MNALLDGGCEHSETACRAGAELDRLAELWQSLRGALSAIDQAVKAASGEPALGLAHWLVLLRLGRRGAMPQSELRLQTGLDSGFLTRLLDELVARQLLQRSRDSVDRRQVQLGITAQGLAAVRAMLSRAGASGVLALSGKRPIPEALRPGW